MGENFGETLRVLREKVVVCDVFFGGRVHWVDPRWCNVFAHLLANCCVVRCELGDGALFLCAWPGAWWGADGSVRNCRGLMLRVALLLMYALG